MLFFHFLTFYLFAFYPFFIIFAADFVSLMNNELLSSLWWAFCVSPVMNSVADNDLNVHNKQQWKK